jgi:predicted site-specific integrase-resolvase
MNLVKMMNGKDLCKTLGISTTLLYKFRKTGMPYHQLPGGRPYYLVDEVIVWLRNAGYRQEKVWTK